MDTWVHIFVACLLAGLLRTGLRKIGWWPDWEERARRREEEKQVLVAYREWRKNAGPGPASDVGVIRNRSPYTTRDGGSVEDRTS